MAKSKITDTVTNGPVKNSLVAAANHIDPTLAALFASSSGPVSAPPTKPTRTSQPTRVSIAKHVQPVQKVSAEDETSSVGDSDGTQSEDGSESDQDAERSSRPRKRRKLDVNEDLESQYMSKILRLSEQDEQRQIQAGNFTQGKSEDEESSSDLNSNLEDVSDSEDEEAHNQEADSIPKHESITNPEIEVEKQSRTAFLGNVAISAIKSKSAKKELIAHVRSALDSKLGEKIESIRFRSTAFVSNAGPKRAAYAKKELMEETMKSTNAYVVLSSQAAVRKLALKLNGTVVLNRHLRVDSLAHPAKIDHKRCVFVGNLSFVDEATAATTDPSSEGDTKRKRAREPADVEEGLWRTFGKVGKIESVRVVRDKETRVSKGFAYVQFENENSVEAALLMNEKKFPPLLPRILRVMRAKREVSLKSHRGDGGIVTRRGRDRGGRMNSRTAPRGMGGVQNGKIVFEGHRATSTGGSMLKKNKTPGGKKPTNRSATRAAAFKASGGKKKRDTR